MLVVVSVVAVILRRFAFSGSCINPGSSGTGGRPPPGGIIQAGICRLPIPVGAVLFGIVSGLVAFLVVGETPYIYFQF